MGHGNVSDLVALSLIGAAVTSIFFTSLFFQDFGPLKASFSAASPEANAMLSFIGGLYLIIGLMLSGVKWNPANGKMSGFGCFLAAYNLVRVCLALDAGAFVLRPTYLLAAFIAVGGAHIMFFPSNAMPPKTEKTKNNHGNISDLVALALLAAAVQCVWYPDLLLQDFGPLKANFTTATPLLRALTQLAGGLLCAIALIFSGVKWNPANGKMSGMGCFLFALNAGLVAFRQLDAGSFVLRPFYVYAAALLAAGLNIFLFPSNPMPPKADAKKSQ